MIYIHALKDLNPKSLEIEATPLLRQIKQTQKLPLSGEKIKEQICSFLISQEDLALGENALALIESAIKEIIDMPKQNPAVYEIISLQRTSSDLKDIPAALKNNMDYAQRILGMQPALISELTSLLNSLPMLKNKSVQEKLVYEEKVKNIFAEILRNKNGFFFNFGDIINEVHLSRVKSLTEMMQTKAVFHVKLEEYLKKMDFSSISKRIPAEEIRKAESVEQKIKEIKIAVEKFYNYNLNMINMAILLYAYIKWLR